MSHILHKPFLKWAGGKSQIAYAISAHMPPSCSRLVEPFVGSASVALNVVGASSHLLSDVNHDLISVYQALVLDGMGFIDECRSLFTPENNTEDAYMRLRREFNSSADEYRKACLFVYLNRHCFNGLMRYNASGVFNTPFGRYRSPVVPEESMRRFLIVLGKAQFMESDFRPVVSLSGKGDFVYADPPYVPVGKTGFTTYAKGGFSINDHYDLARLCEEAAARGAVVVVSNHDNDATRKIYSNASAIHTLMVKRTISGTGDSRNAAAELLAVYGGQSNDNSIFGL